MITKRDLECEIKELQLEIEEKAKVIGKLKDYLNQREYQLKEMKDAQRNTNEAVENKRKENLISDLETKNWYVNMREFTYPMLEVIDENTVKIEGVEYKKVPKEKPQTLYDMLCEEHEQLINRRVICEIVESVERWMSQYECDYVVCAEYLQGYNALMETLKANLK